MKKILIIDDEKRITRAFEDGFAVFYQVFSANDGQKGLELIREKKPDLIVLDWRLNSQVEGKDILLFSKREYPHVPVYVVTASTLEVKEIQSSGADACLLKPCADLLEIIKRALPPD